MNGQSAVAEVPLEVITIAQEAKEIWDLKVAGHSIFEIAAMKQKSPGEINSICQTCYNALKIDLTRLAEMGRMIDLERIDSLIVPWLKAARMPDWMVTMIVDGTPVDIRDAQAATSALHGVIRLFELRAKLMNYQGVTEQVGDDELLRKVMRWMVSQDSNIKALTGAS